jgi:hypothetical protein
MMGVERTCSYLLAQIAANPKIDMANDWKFLNFIIGVRSSHLFLPSTFL